MHAENAYHDQHYKFSRRRDGAELMPMGGMRICNALAQDIP